MSRRVDVIVAELERRYAALDLPHVAAWKAAGPRRAAIGCLPVFAPREVLWAAGALPVFVRGGGDQIETIRGDAYYQSYICRIPRSVLELGLGGWLDALDGMVFPNTCDVIRNLTGIWSQQFPKTRVFFLDPPQSGEQAAAVPFWAGELGHLYQGVCELTGRTPGDAELRDAISAYRRARAAVRQLLAAHAEDPTRHPADEVYLLRRAGDSLPPDDLVSLVAEYLGAAAERKVHVEDRIRVLLVGAFCEQPPVGLLRAIERAGCHIVEDDLLLGHTDIGHEGCASHTPPGRQSRTGAPYDDSVVGAPLGHEDPLASAALAARPPLEALAAAYVSSGTGASVRYDEHQTRGRELVARVAALKADGVVFAAPSFCDPALLDQPRLTKALDDAKIPYTTFKYAENTAQFQGIREQAGTFCDSVKLWGAA